MVWWIVGGAALALTLFFGLAWLSRRLAPPAARFRRPDDPRWSRPSASVWDESRSSEGDRPRRKGERPPEG